MYDSLMCGSIPSISVSALLKSSSVVALAACQRNVLSFGCLNFLYIFSYKCHKQCPCGALGNTRSTPSRSPFWWSDTNANARGARNAATCCATTLRSSWINQNQLSSFSALTTVPANGNSEPLASTAVAVRRTPLYFVLRWVPSRPRIGRQYPNR